MSTSNRSVADLLALEQGCRTCGAARGEWCRIREGYKGAGEPAQFLHVERTWPTYHARWVGYTEGGLDILDQLIYRIDNPEHFRGDEGTLEQVIRDRREQAEKWAQSAHQRALEDIPEGWRR